MASARGRSAVQHHARGEYDLVGLVPTEDISKLAVNQPASIKVIGAGDIEGKIRRVAPTVEPNSQLGQVFIAIASKPPPAVNSSARAQIRSARAAVVAVPPPRCNTAPAAPWFRWCGASASRPSASRSD